MISLSRDRQDSGNRFPPLPEYRYPLPDGRVAVHIRRVRNDGDKFFYWQLRAADGRVLQNSLPDDVKAILSLYNDKEIDRAPSPAWSAAPRWSPGSA